MLKYDFKRLSGIYAALKIRELVNLRIRGFFFWCHDQVICFTFYWVSTSPCWPLTNIFTTKRFATMSIKYYWTFAYVHKLQKFNQLSSAFVAETLLFFIIKNFWSIIHGWVKLAKDKCFCRSKTWKLSS